MELALRESTNFGLPMEVIDAGNAKYQPTILIAEDAPEARLILTSTLSFEGYRCLQASDGEEAVDKAIRHRPDLMLLDLRLPKLNGFQVLMRLQDLKQKTKICMISALDREEFIRRALDFGAADYIVKPILPDTITEKVRSLLDLPGEASYFQLPCSLFASAQGPFGNFDCQVCFASEVGLTLRTDTLCRKDDLVSLSCPAIMGIMGRDEPFLTRVKAAHDHWHHGSQLAVKVEFVGLSETQRQRLRAEVIRGKFLTDDKHFH